MYTRAFVSCVSCQFVYSFVHFSIHSFSHSHVHSFIPLFTHMFIHSLVPLPGHSFILCYTFIHAITQRMFFNEGPQQIRVREPYRSRMSTEQHHV